MHWAVIHSLFDLLAVAAGWLAGRLVATWLPPPGRGRGLDYTATLLAGAALGAYWFGTVNLVLSGQPGIGRSVFGAMVGGVVAIEMWKRVKGVRASTGARLVVPLAVGIGVGRIGCFMAGLEDFTHGTPSSLPWAVDLGDGIPRHPVQLYETALMLGFAGWFAAWLRRDPAAAAARGFYVFAGFYALDRFALEFLKPYGTVAGTLTIFQLGAVLLLAYAVVMYRGVAHGPAKA
ncbi:MAG: prolipoprotein diacylglyceryl transferase [Alphaproteobacteria bacterium]|nr:prolipoprotein diacylglyceryl transferase [Alphaproteobacteria bacterium]